MKIEVSIGEIVDKLTILKIKKNNITDESKLFNIIAEYDYLYDVVFNQLKIESDDFNNDIRDKERDKVFDTEFIELARSVYTTNDKRAEIKKEINLKYGSLFVEEKSYSNYC